MGLHACMANLISLWFSMCLFLLMQPGLIGFLVLGSMATHCMVLLLDVADALYTRCTSKNVLMCMHGHILFMCGHPCRKKVAVLNYGQVAQMTVEDFTGKKRLGVASKY